MSRVTFKGAMHPRHFVRRPLPRSRGVDQIVALLALAIGLPVLLVFVWHVL
jgi:hypothetical protein